ncbi:MAG: hypothetical protein IMZ65_01005 [Planctomycetes bacterium]|nr:hypothetical protein [Planctomycetota bacterium]
MDIAMMDVPEEQRRQVMRTKWQELAKQQQEGSTKAKEAVYALLAPEQQPKADKLMGDAQQVAQAGRGSIFGVDIFGRRTASIGAAKPAATTPGATTPGAPGTPATRAPTPVAPSTPRTPTVVPAPGGAIPTAPEPTGNLPAIPAAYEMAVPSWLI